MISYDKYKTIVNKHLDFYTILKCQRRCGGSAVRSVVDDGALPLALTLRVDGSWSVPLLSPSGNKLDIL